MNSTDTVTTTGLRREEDRRKFSTPQRIVNWLKCLLGHNWLYCSKAPIYETWHRECQKCGKRMTGVEIFDTRYWRDGWWS
jgi:hypothetical protein